MAPKMLPRIQQNGQFQTKLLANHDNSKQGLLMNSDLIQLDPLISALVTTATATARINTVYLFKVPSRFQVIH